MIIISALDIQLYLIQDFTDYLCTQQHIHKLHDDHTSEQFQWTQPHPLSKIDFLCTSH